MTAVERFDEKIVTNLTPEDFKEKHTQNRFSLTSSK